MVAIGYFLLLYFIALQNITNRGAPNQFLSPLRHNPCSAPGLNVYYQQANAQIR